MGTVQDSLFAISGRRYFSEFQPLKIQRLCQTGKQKIIYVNTLGIGTRSR